MVTPENAWLLAFGHRPWVSRAAGEQPAAMNVILRSLVPRPSSLLPSSLLLAAAVMVAALAATASDGAPQSPNPAFARDLAGWEFVTVPAVPIAQVCTIRPDGVVAVAGSPVGYIATVASHANYRLRAEWRWPDKPGNGGALVHIGSGPRDRQWPICFQIQWKNTAVGDLLPMAGASFAEALSTPPGAKTPQLNHSASDSERPAGEWNSCDVTCRGDSIKVIVNGVLQNHVTRCSPGAGRVGFQLEGTPFELRNVSITPFR